jgi:hypothetical protein
MLRQSRIFAPMEKAEKIGQGDAGGGAGAAIW